MVFKFLSDVPEQQNLRFGHNEFLRTLVAVIKYCHNPFAIGLFGPWVRKEFYRGEFEGL